MSSFEYGDMLSVPDSSVQNLQAQKARIGEVAAWRSFRRSDSSHCLYSPTRSEATSNDKAEFQAARLGWPDTQSKQTQQVWWSLNDTLIHGMMISTTPYDASGAFVCVSNDSSQVVPISMLLGPARFNNNSLPSLSAVCWCSKSSSIVICLSARRASGERSGIPPWSTCANRNKTRLPRASPNKRHSNSKTLQPTTSKAAPGNLIYQDLSSPYFKPWALSAFRKSAWLYCWSTLSIRTLYV